jgi:uncharacterized LabA/DUF88 family protein
MDDKVAIFIDGSNLYHGLKTDIGNTRLDMEKFIEWLLNGRRLVRTYYYSAPVDQSNPNAVNQQKYFARLRHIPYFDVRLGRLEPRGNTYVEKGVDIAVAVDMVKMAFKGQYDVAILVSSDGDFSIAVDAVKDTGKHVEIACFAKSYQLQKVADKVIALDQNSLAGLFMH